jgi:hypothetical protein
MRERLSGRSRRSQISLSSPSQTHMADDPPVHRACRINAAVDTATLVRGDFLAATTLATAWLSEPARADSPLELTPAWLTRAISLSVMNRRKLDTKYPPFGMPARRLPSQPESQPKDRYGCELVFNTS